MVTHFKKYLLLLLCSAVSAPVFSQLEAVTTNGDTVILSDNGTWRFKGDAAEPGSDTSLPPLEELPLNAKIFVKPEKSRFVVKGENDYQIWYNEKDWKQPPSKLNSEAEFSFSLDKKDVYAMIIAEKIEIPMETLRGIAIQHAEAASNGFEVVKQEMRMVNGRKMLCMQWEAKVQGITLTYLNYYYSSPKGSFQFFTFTGSTIFEENKVKMEELLNGLVAPE